MTTVPGEDGSPVYVGTDPQPGDLERGRWIVAEMAGTHPPHRNFLDDQHALEAGYLLGYLMSQGVLVETDVTASGDYTARLHITVPQSPWINGTIDVLVLPRG